uniref:Uncharacterized protein n=1 Tax=Anguilla anguilla TaxID=7936 RepID=A0A0E9UZA2_ANGAN
MTYCTLTKLRHYYKLKPSIKLFC